MTGYAYAALPTVNGVQVPFAAHTQRRHLTILGVEPTHRRGPGQGQAFTMTSRTADIPWLAGGEQFIFRNDGAVGAWVEWDLGLLETTRDWDVRIGTYKGSDRAIIRISIDGVALPGGDVDLYNVAGAWPALNIAKIWTPPPLVGLNRHTLRIETVGKNAAGTGFSFSVTGINLSRTAGVATIVQV